MISEAFRLFNNNFKYIKDISRKDFIQKAGLAAAGLLLGSCLGACKKNGSISPSTTTSNAVDFTLDVSTGALSANGGYLVKNGVIVARTSSGSFIAVSSSCTHQGSTVQYSKSSNSFICPSHGATFSSSGSVTAGPASTNLKQYNTSFSGTSLRVYE